MILFRIVLFPKNVFLKGCTIAHSQACENEHINFFALIRPLQAQAPGHDSKVFFLFRPNILAIPD
jgi:hypothetical protein